MHTPQSTIYGLGQNVHLWHFPRPKRPWPKCQGQNVLGRNVHGQNVQHSISMGVYCIWAFAKSTKIRCTGWYNIRALARENLSLEFANTKGADQPAHTCRLICTYDICFSESIISKLCYKWNFNFLASLCSWGDWFESPFVRNPEDMFCLLKVQLYNGPFVSFKTPNSTASKNFNCIHRVKKYGSWSGLASIEHKKHVKTYWLENINIFTLKIYLCT